MKHLVVIAILSLCTATACNGTHQVEIEIVGDAVDVREFPSNQRESRILDDLSTGDVRAVSSRRFAPVIRSAWLKLASGGWVRYSEEMSFRDEATLDELPLFMSPVYDSAPATGSDAVDSLIRAVVAGDTDALAVRTELTPRACGGSDTGDFPCPEGAAPGDLVPVFTFIGCHGQSATETELKDYFEGWLASSAAPFVSIPDEIKFYASFAGQYLQHPSERTSLVLVFGTGPGHGEARMLYVSADGSIVSAAAGCDPLPVEMAVAGVPEFLIPPLH